MVKSKSSLKARATPSPLMTSTVIALPSAPAPTSGAAAIAATAAMAMRIGASTWDRISRAGRRSPFCTWSSGSDGGSGRAHLQSVREREQPGTDHGRLGGREICEPPVLGAATCRHDAHLGKAEKSTGERRDHVDGLDPGKRDAQRLAADEPGLDLQISLGDPPSSDQPRDETTETAEDQQDAA